MPTPEERAIAEQGGKVEKGPFVDRRNKNNRRVRWEQLDDDLAWSARELDRSYLQAVSGAEAQAKTHFVMVEALGVCQNDKTDARPLGQKARNVTKVSCFKPNYRKRDIPNAAIHTSSEPIYVN